ncbi:MAG: STAS domain-containing protein [Fervidobacterium sp.]|nr:STAS domain-containing protein [Fervidobacterium sp.]
MFKVFENHKSTVLSVEKDLTLLNATSFLDMVKKNVLHNGKTKIIVDLSKVSCDTSGLAALMKLNRDLQKLNGKVCIVHGKGIVKTLIEFSKCHEYLSLCENLEEAMEKI